MFTTHRPTLTLQLHNFDLFRTCRTALLRGNWQDFDGRLLRRTERQLSVILEIVGGRTQLLVSEPRLEAVEGDRLVVLVELVGEELAASQQQRKIADAEDADAAHGPAVTALLAPVGVHRQPRLRARVACSAHQPGQLSLASLRGRLTEYQLRLG